MDELYVLEIYHYTLPERIQPHDIRLASESGEKIMEYTERILNYKKNKITKLHTIRIRKMKIEDIYTWGCRLGKNAFLLDSYYPEGIVNNGDSLFLGQGDKKTVFVDYGYHGWSDKETPPKAISIKIV